MQEVLYQTIQEILQAVKAVTAELHARHPEAASPAGGKRCREESCLAVSRLEAQVDTLRRALGLASFRPRDF
jgi:hypothetical protein